MELRQLRHFVSVVEHGSFSEAAPRVFLSQPALTRSIQQLERHLGLPLLIRSARALSLTPAGERFFEYASLIVSECKDARSAIKEFQGGTLGKVRIGVGQTFSRSIIAAALVACRSAMPKVALQTTSGTFEELAILLRRGAVDFAFTTYAEGDNAPGIRMEPLMTLTDLVLIGRSHPLFKSRNPEPSALASSRWAVLNRPFALDAHNRFFVSLGLHVPRAIRTNSLDLVRRLVSKEGFLAMLPREVVLPDLRSGAIRALRTSYVTSQRRAVLMHAEAEFEPAVLRAMQVVRETCGSRGAERPSS
jgi:DNA-binding transcriptional LysR family regulator